MNSIRTGGGGSPHRQHMLICAIYAQRTNVGVCGGRKCLRRCVGFEEIS